MLACIYMQVCSALGYVVATLFFAVVEVSIDTIILSYCQDSEEHQGNARYAPPLLLETLDDQSEMQRLTQWFKLSIAIPAELLYISR